MRYTWGQGRSGRHVPLQGGCPPAPNPQHPGWSLQHPALSPVAPSSFSPAPSSPRHPCGTQSNSPGFSSPPIAPSLSDLLAPRFPAPCSTQFPHPHSTCFPSPCPLLQPNVTGRQCDECAAGTFHLSDANPDGCLKCFCMGVSRQCASSSWSRDQVPCAMPCRAVPRCAMPCQVELCRVMSWHTMLCCAMLCRAMLYFAMLCCVVSCFTVSYQVVLCYGMPCCTMSCHVVLHHVAPHHAICALLCHAM